MLNVFREILSGMNNDRVFKILLGGLSFIIGFGLFLLLFYGTRPS